ncbi:hypothetical protein UFOVP190_128 [uncultured Caudovirales phage]|uniref:Uncharacterized protein n=1 Tax=uncultured Caudovirales phage TaxID=2100421 RepID=A0A6J7WJS9_9CAUD|nr:hypothetical protein UFOVP190_128 [uncultured Caudovirales phage]
MTLKILLTRHETFANEYLSDAVFDGLCELGDVEVTDEPRLWYMYKDGSPGTGKFKSHTELHGRGFTMYRLIGDDSHIDRTDIEGKIKSHYFDLCILARSDFGSPYEDLILEHYPANKIIIICGKDQDEFKHYRDTTHLIGRGTYFKRELTFYDPRLQPIPYAFPRQKLINRPEVQKDKIIAGALPIEGGNNNQKYTFTVEREYYDDYARSFFGPTWKKGGWDCLRHYEIIANKCLPWFTDIHQCPVLTCPTLPKRELQTITEMIGHKGYEWFTHGVGLDYYQDMLNKVFEHFINNNLTVHLAKYVLDTHKRIHDGTL